MIRRCLSVRHTLAIDWCPAVAPAVEGVADNTIIGVPGKAWAIVGLRYQACADHECFLPESVTLRLPLEILPHDWERLD